MAQSCSTGDRLAESNIPALPLSGLQLNLLDLALRQFLRQPEKKGLCDRGGHEGDHNPFGAKHSPQQLSEYFFPSSVNHFAKERRRAEEREREEERRIDFELVRDGRAPIEIRKSATFALPFLQERYKGV